MAAPGTIETPELRRARAALHPALAITHALGPDIFTGLFAWVLEDDTFVRWQHSETNWQLRCCGSPGSGKTTLAAVVVDHLKQKYNDETDAIMSVFIQQDVLGDEPSFIEDFLLSILDQLVSVSIRSGNETVSENASSQLQEYLDARTLRQRSPLRLLLARKALSSCLAALNRSFLVIDGLDRCSSVSTMIIEDELERLRKCGMRIMSTSRIPCLQEPVSESIFSCDAPECPTPGDYASVYFVCEVCRSPETCFVLCAACMEQSTSCDNCLDQSKFMQPYDFVELDISTAPKLRLKELAAWSLESEHGHLGLSDTLGLPPLSTFGITVQASQIGDQLATDISVQADFNIALARARIEAVHDGDSLLRNDSIGDRLPDLIIALFDAAMQRVEQQPPFTRDLGLAVIATVASFNTEGVPAVTVETAVREWALRRGDLSALPRCLEDILRATQGLVNALVPPGEEERYLRLYCANFLTYAAEAYRESLIWAQGQLEVDDTRGVKAVKRSATMALPPLRKRSTGLRKMMPISDVIAETEEPDTGCVEVVRPVPTRPSFRRNKLSRSSTGMS